MRHGPLSRWRRTESALLPLRHVPTSDWQRLRGSSLGAFSKRGLDQCDANLSQVFADRSEGVLLRLRIAAQPFL
jgi:hypothetical protein